MSEKRAEFWDTEEGVALRLKDLAHELNWRTYNNALLMSYKEAGFKKLVWIATLDPRTCEYCESQHAREYRVGMFLPRMPAHVNCIDPLIGVQTELGLRSAAKIQEGDYVLTHKGRLNPVKKVFKHSYKGELFGLNLVFEGKLNRKYILKGLTPNHAVKVRDGWKEIQDIKVGDLVYAMGKPCPYCGYLIPINKTYCSWSCQNKYEREILGIDKWAKPRMRLLEKYGSYANCLRVHNVLFKGRSALGKMKYGTRIEKLVEQWLIREGKEFKKQFLIGVELSRDKRRRTKFRRYRYIDFYVPEEKWFIEADGKMWHDEEKDRIRDLEILSVCPDHKITHIEFGSTLKHETFVLSDLLTNNGHVKFVPMRVKSLFTGRNRRGNHRVWNLSVEPDQSFIVGSPRIVVHNCRCLWDIKEIIE